MSPQPTVVLLLYAVYARNGQPFPTEIAWEGGKRAGWGLTPVSFAGTMQPASRSSSVEVATAAYGRRGGVGEWRRWTAGRTDLELRMGPHTRFHLRIDALGASDTSSMARKGGGGAKASHLRWGGLGISPRISKNLEIT